MADLVLLLHFGVVVFVAGALPVIVAGNRLGWHWVNAPWFRLLHLGAIACVAVQGWLGIECPLTTLEVRLRAESGGPPMAQGFIAHWVQRLMFYTAPNWVFNLVYTGYGLLVAALWWVFPPRWPRSQRP